MTAINDRSLSLPVTTKVVQRVFEARPLNELVFHFMPIDALCIMKGVSRVCRDTGRRVEKERVLKAMPDYDPWKRWGGADCLRAVVIRHFGAPIEGPFSRFPERCMVGFEKVGDNFELYSFERQEKLAHPRVPCLRVQKTEYGIVSRPWQFNDVELLNYSYLREIKSTRQGWWRTHLFVCHALLYLNAAISCCFYEEDDKLHGAWLTDFKKSGGQLAALVPEQKEEEDESDLPAVPKDKSV